MLVSKLKNAQKMKFLLKNRKFWSFLVKILNDLKQKFGPKQGPRGFLFGWNEWRKPLLAPPPYLRLKYIFGSLLTYIIFYPKVVTFLRGFSLKSAVFKLKPLRKCQFLVKEEDYF
jgi:hypothetical protein